MSVPLTHIRWLATACLLTVGGASAAAVSVPTLSVTRSQMQAFVQHSDGRTSNADKKVLPTHAEATLPMGVWGLADLGSGTLKGVAQVQGGISSASSSNSFDFTARNDSLSSLHFADGALTFSVDAKFGYALGDAPSSFFPPSVGNELYATIYVTVENASGAVRSFWTGGYEFHGGLQAGTAAPQYYTVRNTIGAMSLTNVEDANGTSLQFEAGSFSLGPGEKLSILASVIVNATSRIITPATGAYATADFGNTAHLQWQVPAGVQVSGVTPLTWVSAVPEPAAWQLGLAGLFSLVVLRAARRRA